MSGKLFGRATVVINGKTRDTNKGASFVKGGVSRSTVTLSNSARYTEGYQPSKMECEFAFGVGDLVSDFEGAEIQVQFHCDTGQSYSAEMWSTDVPPITDGGLIKMTYEGVAAQEIGA